MGKIKIELMADASSLLDGTELGIKGMQDIQEEAKKLNPAITKAFSDAGTSATNFAAKVNTAKAANEEHKRAIQAKVEALYNEGKVTEALILKYGNATSALKALQNELKTMTALGKQNTAEFKELSNVTGELANKLKNASTEIKSVSSDTQGLDAVSGGFQILTDTVQAGAGAFVGLNNNVKAYQELNSKLIGLISSLNAVKSINNNLEGQSAFSLGVTAAAQRIYTIVVGESTGALKAFRIALAGTGIAAIAFILYELIANWGELTTVIDRVGKEMEQQNKIEAQRVEIMKTANEQASKEISKLQILGQAINDQRLPRQERLKALNEYNKSAEEGNRIAVSEIDNMQKVNEQIQKQTDLLLALAVVQAAKDILAQRIKEQLDLELEKQQKITEATKQLQKNARQSVLGIASDPAIVKAQEAQLKGIVKIGQEASDQAIAEKKDEIQILLKLIQGFQEEYKNVLLGIGNIDAKIRLPQFTTLIDKKTLESTLPTIVRAFIDTGVPVKDRIELLRAMGFSGPDIAKAFSDAFDEDAVKNFKPTTIPKLPFEPIIQEPKNIDFELFGFTIPVKLDISQEELDKAVDATKSVADSIQGYLNDALNSVIASEQKLIDKLDARISKQQEVVAKEQEAANRGSINNLAIETNKLNKLNEAREKALEKQKKIKNAQLAIDTATQLSSLVTAAAQVFQAYSGIPGGTAISAALIAVMFAAFAGAKVAAFAAANNDEGFREGGYTGDGDPSEVSTKLGNRGYKYHKREFVMNEELTATHRELFEAFHAGDKPGIIWGLAELLKDTGVGLPDEALPAELAEARAMHVKITADENNAELRGLLTEMQQIKAELTDWKNRPVESNTALGNSLVTKKGNRTVIKTKK